MQEIPAAPNILFLNSSTINLYKIPCGATIFQSDPYFCSK